MASKTETQPEIFKTLLPLLPEGNVLRVEIGLNWTVVLVEVEGQQSCGLAATMTRAENAHAAGPRVRDAGRLEELPARALAELTASDSPTEVSVGLAAINALLPRPAAAPDLPAEDYIARQGSESRVAVIGHFPFIDSLRPKVRELWVLELNPTAGDLPASAGPRILPQADILAITSTTLINGTFGEIMRYRKPEAKVMLLGPSTPLAPRLFDYGVDVLSGSIVEQPEPILALVRQGANFRQMKGRGVRLVTLEKAAGGSAA